MPDSGERYHYICVSLGSCLCCVGKNLKTGMEVEIGESCRRLLWTKHLQTRAKVMIKEVERRELLIVWVEPGIFGNCLQLENNIKRGGEFKGANRFLS